MQTSSALVAMSGGVDSAVAALLIKEAGYTAMGVTMRLSREENRCCSAQDMADAAAVAAALSMPHEVADFSAAFCEQVIAPFAAAYERAETPNPCILCNRHLKFDALYAYGRARGYDKIVTGHYARIEQDKESGEFRLLRARDPGKDQSYVLYHLKEAQLAHTLFPLGEMTKEEVRARAAAHGFAAATKKDSQDICFVPDGDYAAFLETYLQKTYPPGEFVTRDGRVLGEHRGIIRYTVGQRKGLGLSLPAPLYVGGLDRVHNRVILCEEEALYRRVLWARDVNLLGRQDFSAGLRLTAKVRYRQKDQPATVTQIGADRVRVEFDTPQRAITPGQSVVFYDGDTVRGGGIIELPPEE